jgi:hemolysin D
MSYFAKFKDAWINRATLGGQNKTRELAAFLPAALEIQETPPNPIAKWLGRCLIALFVLIIIWACVGKVNIVASAEGKIIPSTRVKHIQPLEKAVVKKILVTEGEHVEKGQALVELDSTLTHADQKNIAGELYSAKLRLAVDLGLLELLDQPSPTFAELSLNTIITVEADKTLYKRLLWQQWQQYSSQNKGLESALDKTQAEQAATAEIVSKLSQTLPIVNKRAEKMQQLHNKNYASESEFMEMEQERIEMKQDLAAEKQRYKQLQAAEQEAKEQVNSLAAQTRTETLLSVAENQRKIASLQEELAKATDLNEKQILYSPVSGQVQQLAINTVGGVVTEAQELMLIVPDSEKLEVEVFLENKDIGFVHEGMASEIKIHTFPFTKYGIIDAKITNVSDDATLDEKQGLIYGMQLVMKKNTLWVEGKEVKLIPGMAVTAEMQTGHRRIIEFFLAPLLRYGKEGLRER